MRLNLKYEEWTLEELNEAINEIEAEMDYCNAVIHDQNCSEEARNYAFDKALELFNERSRICVIIGKKCHEMWNKNKKEEE